MSQDVVETGPETDLETGLKSASAKKPKKSGGKAAKPKGAKPLGSARKPEAGTLRVQLHLSTEVVERLRVHTALVHRNDSAEVGKILLSYLAHRGQGRELFQLPEEAGEDLCELPDTESIGQDEAAA
jgi:hypothetical protein